MAWLIGLLYYRLRYHIGTQPGPQILYNIGGMNARKGVSQCKQGHIIELCN
nr:MAG TPA: hypothetical protein [Caudoviricetes sp.]DAI91982.1 MAG TPA: hypothetical protein [Caudoviricetes sp.]